MAFYKPVNAVFQSKSDIITDSIAILRTIIAVKDPADKVWRGASFYKLNLSGH